eukprot:gene16931-29121_t
MPGVPPPADLAPAQAAAAAAAAAGAAADRRGPTDAQLLDWVLRALGNGQLSPGTVKWPQLTAAYSLSGLAPCSCSGSSSLGARFAALTGAQQNQLTGQSKKYTNVPTAAELQRRRAEAEAAAAAAAA